ncbi:MAG: DUF3857 domain-containing protein [Candidatus Neomarinimicrobiota bacterium]
MKSSKEIRVLEESEVLITRSEDSYLGFDALRETDFISLSKMEAGLYDMDDKLIRKLGKKDIRESSVSFTSVYNAHNTISHQLKNPELPYKVKKHKEYKIKSTFFLPSWNPQENVPVNQAELEIVMETPFDFKYKNIGRCGEPEISLDKNGFRHYRWEIDTISAYKKEFRQAPEADFQIGVDLVPAEFDLDGFQGNTTSWKEFGLWDYSLIKDQIIYSKNFHNGQKYLSIADPIERIHEIYRELQQKTRYVQIYLGIDGWQPHPVDIIDQVKYGDCKDLSIYMIAMLDQAGIRAYPALAMPRSHGWVDPGFVANSFNHCIAVVPMPSDTFYLECTSDVTSMYDIPDEIEGTNILLITPDGGKLIGTPLSTATMNGSVLTGTATINPDRSLDFNGQVLFTGNQATNMRGLFSDKSMQERREWFINRICQKSGQTQIKSFSLAGLENPDTALAINFSVNMQFYTRKAGSRLLFEPVTFNKIIFDGEEPGKRKTPLLNISPISNTDNICFILPEGYQIKNQIDTDSIRSVFGIYYSNVINQNGQIIWIDNFTCNARYVSLDEYPAYFKFMQDAKKNSNHLIVLEK